MTLTSKSMTLHTKVMTYYSLKQGSSYYKATVATINKKVWLNITTLSSTYCPRSSRLQKLISTPRQKPQFTLH